MTQSSTPPPNHSAAGETLLEQWKRELAIRGAPKDLTDLLDERDIAVKLLARLREFVPPAEAAIAQSTGQLVWEGCGLFLCDHGRLNEALGIFAGLYDRMLEFEAEGKRVHKGMPLVWISDCHLRLNRPTIAKRYLMLTACEDAIRGEGQVDPKTTGVYFRLVWQFGMSDGEVRRYAKAIWEAFRRDPTRGAFPEWILQQLDSKWMTEFPSVQEHGYYVANTRYISLLRGRLGNPDGKDLESLASYVFSLMPGCRVAQRKRSRSTEYDVVCSVEGLAIDYRSEFGRYFVLECKDWKKRVNFTAFAKFCRVLDSLKCRFGVIVSRNGITGKTRSTNAAREQLKVFQDRGLVIVVLDDQDLKDLEGGASLISLLREKYESVRLDIP